MEKKYHPEEYWTEVGQKIDSRVGANVIAGDDEPFYRYKRIEFLKLLNQFDFSNLSCLEVGNGPGGNLLEVLKQKPKKLQGVDISDVMVGMARKKLPSEVIITKINGTSIPFEDNSIDVIFTATVLQHNTDDVMLRKLMAEICRVSGDKVLLFERIENSIKGDDLCLGRPVDYYAGIMKEGGFSLADQSFINIRASYYVSGFIRKVFNSKNRKEGDPLNGFSTFLQNITLPITKVLDKVFTSKKDVAKLVFVKDR